MSTTATQTDVRYPVGKFERPERITAQDRRHLIEQIAALPQQMRAAVSGLTRQQLDTPYREGGWTPRQVVHHLADAHMHAYIRFKHALAEDKPTIKQWHEERWSTFPDVNEDVELSLRILDGVHGRMAALLRSLKDEQFATEFVHPERGTMTIDGNLAMYAWHGRHHVGHITSLRSRKGW
jgi:hypothetical protein